MQDFKIERERNADMKNKNMFLVGAAILMGLTACGKKPNTPAESSEPAATSEVVATSETTATSESTSEAHVHSYGEWAVTKTATHTEEGEETRTCECGEKETRPVSKTSAHEWSEWVETKAPTHTEEGKKERTCPCGEKETDTIAKTSEHQYGDWKVTKEATCEETGSRYRECPCGDKDTESIPAKGHTFGDWTTKEAQCLVAGEKTRVCSTCGKEEKEVIPATGHTNSESWSYDGETHYHVCSTCGEKNDTKEHTLKAQWYSSTITSGHHLVCSCGYKSEVVPHEFNIENKNKLVNAKDKNHGSQYAKSCECGAWNVEYLWDDGEPELPVSYALTQMPELFEEGIITATYANGDTLSCPLQTIDNNGVGIYKLDEQTGNCDNFTAIYSVVSLSDQGAKELMDEKELSDIEDSVAYKNLLTHMGEAGLKVTITASKEHDPFYCKPVNDCSSDAGASGYYHCRDCEINRVTKDATAGILDTELAALKITATSSTISLENGTSTVTGKLTSGTIRNGEKVQWTLPNGKINTGTVSNLSILENSEYVARDVASRKESDVRIQFEVDEALMVRIGVTGITVEHAYTHHVDSSLGYCDKCGLTPGMNTNVFSVTGTLYTESENVILDKSTHKVLIDGKEYSAYFSNVYDNTTALEYAGKGHIFNADILVDGGYNFHVGTTISFAEEEKITASMSINLCWDKDIIMHEAGDVSFRSDGNIAYAHDANEDRYWLDDFNGTETTKDAVTILSGSSKSTSWIMVDEVKTDSIGTYTVAILNKGSVAVGDTFDIYDADNNDITPAKTTCKLTKITAVANSNLIPTSPTVGESYRFYLKTFTLTMNKGGTLSETDTTETNIIQGRYCAFGIE